MVKVTIILPTYNRNYLLTRALKSLNDQTYRHFDAIIVDDHSDVPVTVDKRLYNFPIKSYRLRKNSGGHARPRNYGIMKTKSKYIGYLDDDDEYKSDHIEVLVKAIESGDYDFAYGRREYIEDGKITNESTVEEWNYKKAGDRFWFGSPDILHTKEIMVKLGGWNEDTVRFTDYELGWRLGRIKAKGVAVNKVISVVHRHGKQLTNDNMRQGIDLDEYIKFPIRQKWLKELKKTK